MSALMRLSWLALALAAAHVLVGIGMAVFGNPSGWLGGFFYAMLYAVPLLLLGLALRSPLPRLHTAAGWAALLLGVFNAAVPVGNWSGYSSAQALFVLLITVPTVALYLAVVWFALFRRSHRPANPHPAA